MKAADDNALPLREPDQPFTAPWQAHAFAMVLLLHERGVFTWPEWAAELSRQIHAPSSAAEPPSYYDHWLAALEALVAKHQIAAPDVLRQWRDAWESAAARTPHGQPIEAPAQPGGTR